MLIVRLYIFIVVVCFPLHHELLPIWAFCKYATLKKKLIRRNGGLRPADSLWENKITGWMLSFFFSFSFLIIWICNGLFNKPWYGYRKWALILFIYLFIFYDLWQVSSWQTGCITQSKNKTGEKKKIFQTRSLFFSVDNSTNQPNRFNLKIPKLYSFSLGLVAFLVYEFLQIDNHF